MTRIFLIAALVLAPALTSAQAWLTAPCTDRAPLPVPTTAAKPICMPSPKGAGSSPVIEVNDFGVAAAFWCKRPAPKPPVLYLYAARWDAVTTSLVTDLVMIGLTGAQTAAIQSTLLKHQTQDIRDMCSVWGPAVGRITAAKPQ